MSQPTFYIAGCIITNAAGEILLLHRHTDKRSQWEIPGGKIDPSEDARATAARELKEELGVDVEVRHKLGECYFNEEGQEMHYSWFVAHIVSGQPRIGEPQVHDMWAYKSLDAMKEMDHHLSASGRRFLEQMTRGDIRLDSPA